jgi:hypothetical protein
MANLCSSAAYAPGSEPDHSEVIGEQRCSPAASPSVNPRGNAIDHASSRRRATTGRRSASEPASSARKRRIRRSTASSHRRLPDSIRSDSHEHARRERTTIGRTAHSTRHFSVLLRRHRRWMVMRHGGRSDQSANRRSACVRNQHNGVDGQGFPSDLGSPNLDSVVFSKRVRAQIWLPARVSTNRPVPWKSPSAERT